MQRLMTMVLAGGKGKHFYPLTQHRAKPAFPSMANVGSSTFHSWTAWTLVCHTSRFYSI